MLFDPRTATLMAHNINLFQVAGKTREYENPGFSTDGKDKLGRPFFMDFKVISPTLGEYSFPHEPLVRISNRKHIIETSLNGSKEDIMVNELVNSGNKRIEIKGILFNPDTKRYPEDQVRELWEFYNLKESLEVECDKLELFDVHNLVFQSLVIDSMVGNPTMQKYTIRAKSDVDFYAQLQQDDLNGVYS